MLRASLPRTLTALTVLSSALTFSIIPGTRALAAGNTPAAAPQFLDDDAEPSCDVAFGLDAPGSGRSFQAVFDWQDAGDTYGLICSAAGAQFTASEHGETQKLAFAPVEWAAHNKLVLQRRPWLVRLLVNENVVLTAYDSEYNSGQIGALPGALTWSDPRVQPVEAIHFDDDFTRAGTEGTDAAWTNSSGTWALTASSARINAGNAEMSSNPFAYAVDPGTGTGFSWNGRWFWDDYDSRVSVRPSAAGTVGIGAYVQDPDNYLAFEWSAGDGPDARRLICVRDGKRTVLASGAGGYLPRQWYQIGLRTSPGYVEALLDGVPVLRARDLNFGEGGVALLARGTAAVFDDAGVRSYDFYRQDFQDTGGTWTPHQGAWLAQGGRWAAHDGVLNSVPLAAAAPGTVTPPRLLMAGRPDWNGFQMLVSARAGDTGAAGIVTGFKDANDYSVFRWAGWHAPVPFHGRQQFVRYENGRENVLRDAPLSVDRLADPTGFVRLTVRFDTGATAVYAGGDLVEQAGDTNSPPQGLAGLWAQGAALVGFRDVVIFFPPPPEVPRVAPRMQDDSYMVGWASPTGEWPPSPGENGLEFWNTGDFFGDARLEFPWHSSWRGTFEAALRANRGDFQSGYILRGESSDDGSSVKWSVLRGDQLLQSAVTPMSALPHADDDDGARLAVVLRGRGLLLSSAGTPILNVLEAEPAAGTTLAVRARGFRIHADQLRAVSANRDDYTFTDAPVDFYTPQGNWSVFSRWPCYGDWSFFGGKGLNPIMWSKRTFGGDLVVEMYAHNQMDLPKEVGYSHPGDLNISIAADGSNPASGYSFVVGGWYNTRTKILRGTQPVAEESGPNGHFDQAINHNMHWHRRWVYVRAEVRKAVKDGKTGVNVILTVDDNQLLTYFDPQPLALWNQGGRVAFWTTDSSLMIARAKIEAQNPGVKGLPSGLVDALGPQAGPDGGAGLSPQAVVVDGVPSSLVSRETVAGGAKAWRIMDSSCGGAFATEWNRAPLAVGPHARIEMDVKIPAGVNVDLYATTGDTRNLVELTGGQLPDAAAPSLGRAVLSAPNAAGWRHMSFDLGAALLQANPGENSWTINDLTIGALHGDPYRYVGFYGNNMGSTYEVSNPVLHP